MIDPFPLFVLFVKNTITYKAFQAQILVFDEFQYTFQGTEESASMVSRTRENRVTINTMENLLVLTTLSTGP